MIKIQSYGASPGWYQTDQSYNLPSITGAVQWNGNTKNFEVSNGSGWMRIDNTVQISNTYDMAMIAQWVTKKMAEEEETKKLRSKYPALDEAYNHLELIKALVTAGTDNDLDAELRELAP
jgi:hypothetical protein